MPYSDEDNNRLGYNKDGDGKVSKVSRLTNYYDENHNKNEKHGHELIDMSSGTYGYRGENSNKRDFRKDFDDAKFKKK